VTVGEIWIDKFSLRVLCNTVLGTQRVCLWVAMAGAVSRA